jgi:energy-coupling factor transporter ATP-binding protein EcfA2
MQPRDTMELREADIRAHYPAALALLEGFDHAPRLAKARAEPPAPDRSAGIAAARPRFRPTTPGLAARPVVRAGSVRLIERIGALAEDGLPTPLTAAATQALRRALAIALAMTAAFAERTGLPELKRANLESRLPETRRAEFADLLAAEALVALHAFANAAAFLIAPHLTEVTVDVGGVDEVLTDNAPLALHGALWELDQDIAAFADEARLAATLAAFAEALMARAAARAEGNARTAPYAQGSWRIEADGLTLAGFTPARKARGSALAMAFKRPQEVIGNHIAKHQAMKLAKMLMAYDFGRRLNPFAELGGFVFTFMGDGAPGTGKTTLIQMMAGLIHDYCKVAGYPFRYANFSIDQIDSYQGRSGQNAKAFVDQILDPAVIGFGTIDDIDQVAGRRGDRQSSAGQQEVTAVFMQAFAGASTVVRGNCTFGMFSNFPENVDDALRQRAGARFLIDGPQSRADYIDILALLLGKNHAIPVGDHDLMAAQEIRRAVAAGYAAHDRPQEARLAAVWQQVEAAVGPLDTLARLGTYLHAIHAADPRFTGRAVKNITDAVKVRAMDVDLPEEWLANPETFLFRPYEAKMAMLRELLTPITPRMVIQEINRYADAEFRYAGNADERAVEAMVQEMERAAAARRRYQGGRESGDRR